MTNTKSNTQAGFTLIELLITTSLTVLLMLTITTMFMTFLISNSRTNVRKIVKEEGLYALNQMEFILKNAFYVDETSNPCTTNMTEIDIVSLDRGSTTFNTITDLNGSKIASNGATLTSNAVDLTGLRFDCSGSPGNRVVTVRFTLEKITPTLSDDAQVTENFETTVQIRN